MSGNQFEIPKEMRSMAEASLDQARKAFETFISSGQEPNAYHMHQFKRFVDKMFEGAAGGALLVHGGGTRDQGRYWLTKHTDARKPMHELSSRVQRRARDRPK